MRLQGSVSCKPLLLAAPQCMLSRCVNESMEPDASAH